MISRRSGRLCAAIALTGLAVAASAPSAQAFYGSFRASCRIVSDDGNFLAAYCRRLDGSLNYTTITNCGGVGVRNEDGVLRCGT